MALGIIFSLLGIGILIAIMFQMAIFALPLFIAVTAGRFAYETGAGVVSAFVVGLIAAAVAFSIAQIVLATTRSTAVRLIIAFAFAAPAAFAGYHVVLGLSHIGGAHGLWQPIFAGTGAVVIAGASLARLATPLVPVEPAHFRGMVQGG